MSEKSVIIIGASGLVGIQVLGLLLKDPTIEKICAPSRRPLGIQNIKLSNPTFPFSEFEVNASKLSNAEDLYFCYGTTLKSAGSKENFIRIELKQSLTMINACLKKGVKRLFLISSAGADSNSAIFYSKIKGQIEDFANDLVLDKKLADLVILRPSLLLGNRTESRPGEAFLRMGLKPLLFAFVGPLKSSKPVWDWQVANILVKAAKTSSGKGIRIIKNEEISRETKI